MRVYTNVNSELLTYVVGVAPISNFRVFTAVFVVVSAMTIVYSSSNIESAV